MGTPRDETAAIALANDLNRYLVSQQKTRLPGWEPTQDEYERDMAEYDAGLSAILHKHKITRGSAGGDILHVNGSWYVQFADDRWSPKFSPTGLFTITPIKVQAVEREGDSVLLDLETAEPDTENRFTTEIGHDKEGS